jgi:lipid-A-disaccharide synthase
MIVAGEASGDTHAAKLVAALRDAVPGVEHEFFGSAGPKMREAGVEALVQADGLSIVGLAEIASALPMFIGAFNTLKRAAVERKADAVVLVDFPEFNLKLARVLKKKGLKVIYYISPQLWAWRKYRLETVKRYVDLLITILPFEKDWYETNAFARVEYVGSPLAREVHPTMSKTDFCSKHSLDPQRPIIALLPGSREKEIVRIVPVMLAAARLIGDSRPDVQFVLAFGSGKHAPNSLAEDPSERLLTVVDETYNALSAADAAAITSGTATLEAGILDTPMTVVYKTSPLNYRIFAPMIDVPHYGLINLIAGRRVATELIQDDLTPKSLADELLRLLEPAVNVEMRRELKTAADSLGHGGASKRAAEAIVKLLGLSTT